MPEVLTEELLRAARVVDEGGGLPVTGNKSASDGHVTGNSTIDEAALKETADTFLMTIPPRDHKSSKKLLYRFIGGIGTLHTPVNRRCMRLRYPTCNR